MFGNTTCADPEGRVPLAIKNLNVGSQFRVVSVAKNANIAGFTATFTTATGSTSAFSACANVRAGTDVDRDGVPDIIEASGNTPADAGDPLIATFLSDADQFVTLVAPNGTTLSNVGPIDDPAPNTHPAGFSLPFGLYSFQLNGVTTAKPVDVVVLLPQSAATNGYWKYGRSVASPSAQWYAYPYDRTTKTGALRSTVSRNGSAYPAYDVRVQDGGPGDDDRALNGTIIDPGGPSQYANEAVVQPQSSTTSQPATTTIGTVVGALPATGSESMRLVWFALMMLLAGAAAAAVGVRARPGARIERNVNAPGEHRRGSSRTSS